MEIVFVTKHRKDNLLKSKNVFKLGRKQTNDSELLTFVNAIKKKTLVLKIS